MGRIISRKEHMQEQAAHPGQTKYKIYYKDPAGRRVVVLTFWADSVAAAKTELDIFVRKNELVDPDDRKEYFYGRSGGILCDKGGGMLEEFDEFRELMDDKETLLEKVKYFFMSIGWWLRDVKYAFADFWYWYRHYDKKTNKSHQRFESWNLDSAVLDMLEWNIPIIIKDKNGVPNEFCVRARQMMHEGDKDFDAKASFKTSPNSSDEEFKLAEKLWDEELEKMLLHIRLYRYYSDHGIVSKDDGDAYAEIDRKYGGTIPYKPGTDKEIDYQAIDILVQREWHAIWDWMSKNGQMLWT